jgi:acetyl esterase/lipase
LFTQLIFHGARQQDKQIFDQSPTVAFCGLGTDLVMAVGSWGLLGSGIMKLLLLGFFVVLVSASFAPAQGGARKDIAYNDKHPSQVLDFYPAKSEKPAPIMVYIHGGGWRGGSKAGIPAFLAKANAEGWLAVVSVEYRFTDVATHPAQVDDCARAIQFIRQNAKQWNVDPTRMGVTGGSAGGHLSAYIALQDDEANPHSEDPIERQSSRVSFAIPFAGPTDWGLLGKIKHAHPAYRQLLGYEPGTAAEEMSAEKKKDVSPLSFVSKDDPPFLIVHGDADVIVPVEHAKELDSALQAAQVPTELYVVKGGNHGVAGAAEPGAAKRADAYMREHLLDEKP